MVEQKTGQLSPGFSKITIWAFSIGTSIGWGSFIVTCNTLLQKSGLLGTLFGMLVGMVVILVVTRNVQYMIQCSPDAGGIFAFEKKIGGEDLGFISFWFVLLTYLAIFWANVTSVPLFARFFLGNLFQFGFHYSIFGYSVWFGEVILSICAVGLIGFLCVRSKNLPNQIMVVSALAFTVVFTACAIFAVLNHNPSFSYSPLYIEGSNPFGQIIRTAAISPWAFIGFENIAHFSEEYTFPVKKIGRILITSVVGATLLYLFVTLLSVSAYPPEYANWLAYIKDMGNLQGIKAVPAFYAAQYYLGDAGVKGLLVALFGVIVTSLIGNLLALSRLLYAAGREGEAPSELFQVNSRGIPYRAIYAVMAISSLIPFLGRTAIGWIVDVTTLGSTLIYALLSFAVYRYAREHGEQWAQISGMTGLVMMSGFLMLLLIPGLLPFHAMETESYMLFIAWSVLGLVYFRLLVRRKSRRQYKQRVLVWVIFLTLILFASTMWVSRETESAADRAAETIYQYHQAHPETNDADEEREHFLREQARQISRTNTIYTMVSLGFFVIAMGIIMNNYKENLVLEKKLTKAEEEVKESEKIRELKESISALLDNMPCLSFSKDSQTGIYLACNQAFAEYAHKNSPDGVIGLTDREIFDEVTAGHFEDDDRMALSMDSPYIFFEEVKDGAGNQRQFQTTKLKYLDDNGRLCILGMCQDVTDMVRIQRENATTKEAYEKARNTGIIYNHIAQTLARSYMNLYYVNLDTNDFIEYVTDEASGMLEEVRRGVDFFEECKIECRMYVYQKDWDVFLKGIDRERLLAALDRNGSYMMTYRLLMDGEPTYVNMNVYRMMDDERFIIIGILNVDEETKQRKIAERMKEERIAYARLNALTGNFLCMYVLNPENEQFRQFSASEKIQSYDLPKEGYELFDVIRAKGHNFIYEEDYNYFLSLFTKERVLAEISRSGIFVMTLRVVLEGKPIYTQIKAARVEEQDGERIVLGFNDVDSSIRQEEDYAKRLALAQKKASIDALTGVKNKHAFVEAEDQLDLKIAEHRSSGYAIVILDVNDLKKVNDSQGHLAGDQYLRDACKIICDTFKRSPVFRIGGDEFAVIAEGADYEAIDNLVEQISDRNEKAANNGGIVIACGMAKYEHGLDVGQVFEQADQNMYENKALLKNEKVAIPKQKYLA